MIFVVFILNSHYTVAHYKLSFAMTVIKKKQQFYLSWHFLFSCINLIKINIYTIYKNKVTCIKQMYLLNKSLVWTEILS